MGEGPHHSGPETSVSGSISHQQGIFEIEAGAFDESQPTHEIVRRKCPIIFFRNFFCGSGKHLIICTYVRIRMNTSHSIEKLSPLRHCTVCFTYVHAGSFLGTKHGPEGGRGDDKATVNAQHTSNTINAVVRLSLIHI